MNFGERVSAYEAYLESPHGRLRSEIVWHQLSSFMAKSWSPEAPPLQILDIGCGTGELTLRLAARGHAVTLLDPVKEMLDLAQEKTHALEPPPSIPPRFVAGSIEEASDLLEGKTFDLLLCHTVVEYLPNPESALPSIRSLLNLGGFLSLVTLNHWQEPFRHAIRDHKFDEAKRALAGESFTDTVFELPRKAVVAEEFHKDLEDAGIEVIDHAGILVFSDYLPAATLEDLSHLPTLFHLELKAGARSPIKEMARYLHFWGRRAG
jgi:S-adenosylmethionine-dependent methyltransferase